MCIAPSKHSSPCSAWSCAALSVLVNGYPERFRDNHSLTGACSLSVPSVKVLAEVAHWLDLQSALVPWRRPHRRRSTSLAWWRCGPLRSRRARKARWQRCMPPSASSAALVRPQPTPPQVRLHLTNATGGIPVTTPVVGLALSQMDSVPQMFTDFITHQSM